MVPAEFGGQNMYCPRNQLVQILNEIKQGKTWVEQAQLQSIRAAKPTKDLVARIIKSVDETISMCQNPPM